MLANIDPPSLELPMSHDANEVRKLAEAADGTRGRDVFFVVDGDELKPATSRPGPGKGITVNTEFHGPGLRGAESLTVTHGTIPPNADAAFTSQSAFEKFVLPYYIRTRSVDELKEMLTKAYAEGITCAFHDPDSETGTTGGTGLGLIKTDGTIDFI
jgi:hypothetical protein